MIFSQPAKGWEFCCNVRFRVAGVIDFDGHPMHQDAHIALTMAVEHVAKQLRRRRRAMREDKPVKLVKDSLFRRHGHSVTADDEAPGMIDDGVEDEETFLTLVAAGSRSPALISRPRPNSGSAA